MDHATGTSSKDENISRVDHHALLGRRPFPRLFEDKLWHNMGRVHRKMR